jgi:periplasmic copper chaperone A
MPHKLSKQRLPFHCTNLKPAMKFHIATKIIAACAIGAWAMPVFSHVSLETMKAPAGSTYKAVFQVGHGCQGSPTTGISVQIPAGFQGAKPYPKAGWALETRLAKLARPYDNHGKQVSEDVTTVSWTAASKEAALPEAYFDEFMLRGRLPDAAGPMWFKVLQTCTSGSANWSEVPAPGASAKTLKLPALLLEIVASSAAAQSPTAALLPPVQVSGAWVRATVPGQKGSGAFMKITSQTALRLVGISSPAAGVAEVHEMKMDGDVMKMRAVDALDLPAGKTVELKSGGYHVMLMDLRQTLPKGSMMPMTLRFRDANGVESKLDLSVPVGLAAPSGGAGKADGQAAAHDMHKR